MFEPQGTWFTFIKVGSCYNNIIITISGLVFRIGSSFFARPNSKHKSRAELNRASKKCCHVGIHVVLGIKDLGPV